MKKLFLILLCVVMSAGLSACSAGRGSDAMQAAEAYIDGISKFTEAGAEYDGIGMQLQADYAYGYALASVSSMRLCVDTLLYHGGEGASLEEVIGERTGDWDEIALYNLASPFPWLFQSLSLSAQGDDEKGKECYENVLINPAYDSENGDYILYALAGMTAGELKSLKKKLCSIEDKILTVFTPEETVYPRNRYTFSDIYLLARGDEAAGANNGDFTQAVYHYEKAVEVNPFNGDNFVSCALGYIYLGDMNKAIFYVNEGLYADPEHEGLNNLKDSLNEWRDK